MSDKGAHFFRCDLQVHTPRDINWTGVASVTDEERAAYAARLVKACRDRGLQGIAITDHHDMAFVETVRTAATAESDQDGKPLPRERRLTVFPGMELTLGVPCQALLIFDAELPCDMFSLAMTALAITPSPVTAPKTAPIERLTRIASLRQLKDELDKHTYLRDRYIIFPNVGESGQFSLIRLGQAGKYVEMPCVGGYVDGEFSKVGTGNQNIIAGKTKEWGHKRIAYFQTSDSRHEDHRDLGRVSTWIKWAVPTAEALRQACLAQESRVSQTAPQLPTAVVTGISVSNSAFLGPVEVEFNPQYNALIGGRGTGKSTVLEYLRWALCDQPPGIADEDSPNYQTRRGRLIEQTLKPVSATVQVSFEINGVPHIVRRSSQDGSLLIKITDDEMRPCTEDEVRTLFPIQAYSQKQLSDVSVRVEELSRFVTAPLRAELTRIDRRSTDQAELVRRLYGTTRRQRSLTQTLQRRGLEERSLTGQASMLRTGLTGLSEDDRALLNKGRAFDLAQRSMQHWQDGATRVLEGASTLLRTIDPYLSALDLPPTELEPDELLAAYEEYRTLLKEAKASLDELVGRAEAITAGVATAPSASPWRRWAVKLTAFRAGYDAAMERSSAHSEKMVKLRDIEERLSEHVRETARVRDELQTLTNANAVYLAERDAWVSLLKERDDLLEEQCRTMTEASGGAIRAGIKRYAGAADFVNGLRQYLSGSRVQSAKIEALGESIAAGTDGEGRWAALLSELEKLAEFEPDRDGKEGLPETPHLLTSGLTAGDLYRIANALKPDNWLALSLTPIGSEPVFEYRARESEYIPFRNASAGQQATALLKTLLNQVGPPLVIDQPEEDLDNPVMLEIVEQVWRAKQKRQLIFASHNANLVVNGDAELVVCCSHRAAGDQSRGTIGVEGAIDVSQVREAIKQIMEGGEAAFNLRRAKYGF